MEEPFLVPQRTSQRLFKEPSLPYLFIIWRTFFHHKEPFVKQKGSSDVKGSLWNHLDKKVLLWHRETQHKCITVSPMGCTSDENTSLKFEHIVYYPQTRGTIQRLSAEPRPAATLWHLFSLKSRAHKNKARAHDLSAQNSIRMQKIILSRAHK